MTTAPKYFLVKAISKMGRFRRCEIQFDTNWRPIELGDRFDPHATPPMVTPEKFARIQIETVGKESERLELEASIEEDPERRNRLRDKREAAIKRGEIVFPTMLVMRPAEAREVVALLSELELAALTPERELAREREKNAALQAKQHELEARLMKLELAQGGKASK